MGHLAKFTRVKYSKSLLQLRFLNFQNPSKCFFSNIRQKRLKVKLIQSSSPRPIDLLSNSQTYDRSYDKKNVIFNVHFERKYVTEWKCPIPS